MWNGVQRVGFGETDGSFGGGVLGNNKLCASGQVAKLMQVVGLAAHPNTTFAYINIFWGVRGGLRTMCGREAEGDLDVV